MVGAVRALDAPATALSSLAMAAAASGGLQVRRVVSTAVASRRTARGRFALRGCLASLRSGDMQGFGYQITLASYSSSFLAEHEARVPKWVDALARECTSEGVGAIIAETLATTRCVANI